MTAKARAHCRSAGLAGCIHHAPNWRERADALYAYANESGLPWLPCVVVGLLPDGRMATVGELVCVFEPKAPI
jgi:hypothetical protein